MTTAISPSISAVSEIEYEALLAAGVKVAPGSGFFPGDRLPGGTLFLRLAFRALTEPEFATGAALLADVLAR